MAGGIETTKISHESVLDRGDTRKPTLTLIGFGPRHEKGPPVSYSEFRPVSDHCRFYDILIFADEASLLFLVARSTEHYESVV